MDRQQESVGQDLPTAKSIESVSASGAVVASPETREKITAVLKEHGPNKTAKLLKVGREIPVRIAAGIPVRRGSLLLAEQNVQFIPDLARVG